MSTIKNPLNQNTAIDLLPMIQTFEPAYGFIADSGLFEELPAKTKAAMFEIEDAVNVPMTKLTSRTERDSVRVAGAKSKWVTVAGRTIKLDNGVHVEDLQNRMNGFLDLNDESVQDALIKKTKITYDSFAQSYEYMLVTASQGRVRDPKDGSVVIDMFTNTGTVQSTATIDLSPTSTSVVSGFVALRNQVNRLNAGQGAVGLIELVVTDAVFNALYQHPEIVGLYQMAYAGRGQEALNQPVLNGSANRPTLSRYGWRREMVIEGFIVTTYPNTFTTMSGGTLEAITGNKGWTIVRGATDAYEVHFAPAPYFSQLNAVGQKVYARSTGIVDDTHIDFTIESHLTPLLKRPELSVDVTFTLA